MNLVGPVVKAWRAWDRHPAHDRPAERMEDACRALAGSSGVGTTALRARMQAHRRDGLDYRAAVDAALRDTLAP